MTRHIFVIDPLRQLNEALDTSTRLAAALFQWEQDQGQKPEIELWPFDGLFFDGCLKGTSIRVEGVGPGLKVQLSEGVRKPLGHYDLLHMRKDPPLDAHYWSLTWLLELEKGRVWNRLDAVRGVNEKISIHLFPSYRKEFALVRKKEDLADFVRSFGPHLIVKPLDLFGGRGVERFHWDHAEQSSGLWDGSLKMVQAFDPKIHEGEVRVFTACGEPVAWCLKKPKEGSYLANTRSGATLSPYEPTPKEERDVRTMASTLMAHGIYYVGFDLIGGFVSEINITSPRLLSPPRFGDPVKDQALEKEAYLKTADLTLREIKKGSR